MKAIPRIIDEDSKRDLLKILKNLVNPVNLFFFIQKNASLSSTQQKKLLKELASLSDKITLKVYNISSKSSQKKRFNIERTPATAVVGENDYGIRFYGLTFILHQFKWVSQGVYNFCGNAVLA